jgi:hypothetical protein
MSNNIWKHWNNITGWNMVKATYDFVLQSIRLEVWPDSSLFFVMKWPL